MVNARWSRRVNDRCFTQSGRDCGSRGVGFARLGQRRGLVRLMAGPVVTAVEIAAIVASCASVHPVVKEAPVAEIVFHAEHESGMQRFAVGVNKDTARGLPARSESFSSEAQAVAFADSMLRAGRSIDVGPMQINLRAHPIPHSFPSLAAAFDVGLNVCYGAQVLGEAYKTRREARCAYNAGPTRPHCPPGYPEGIDRAARLVTARLLGGLPAASKPTEPQIVVPPAPPRLRPAGTAFQRVMPAAPPRADQAPPPARTEAPVGDVATRLAENRP